MASTTNGRAASERVQRTINLTDANNECEHGSLPLDRVVKCGCWPAGSVEALATITRTFAGDTCCAWDD